MNLKALDRLYLMGDEDSDVSVNCKDCDRRGGLPIIFYAQSSQGYAGNPYVVNVRTIGDMINAMIDHVRNVHGISV